MICAERTRKNDLIYEDHVLLRRPLPRPCGTTDSRVRVSWSFLGEASEMYAVIFNDQTK